MGSVVRNAMIRNIVWVASMLFAGGFWLCVWAGQLITKPKKMMPHEILDGTMCPLWRRIFVARGCEIRNSCFVGSMIVVPAGVRNVMLTKNHMMGLWYAAKIFGASRSLKLWL